MGGKTRQKIGDDMTTDNKQVDFIKHTSCPHCGSSDANSVYSDGHAFCFSCRTYTEPPKDPEELEELLQTDKYSYTSSTATVTPIGIYRPIVDRGIDEDVCRLFGVTITNPDKPEVTKHHYPYYDNDGMHIATKVRRCKDKTFNFEGKVGKSMLFGQQLFSKGSGKYITICEGEIDALSIYQMMKPKNYPVVSIRTGAAGAVSDCKKHYEFLNSFEKIFLCFDNDDPGKEARKKVAEIFPPKKVHIINLSLKDPNEYLMQNKQREFMDRYWSAKPYTPEGIILGENTWDLVANDKEVESLPYPWDNMNEMTYGMRLGELCTFTAGSGIGKSSVMRELAYHIIKNSEHSVGCLFLEESIERTAKGLMSVHGNQPFHLPLTETTTEQKRRSWEATLGTGRVKLWDHFGSTDIDNIISKVQYLASALDCKFIILDHLTMIVSAMTGDNERRAIDSIMTRLRTLVQEQNIHLMLVSHLSRRTSSDSGHEEGAIVSLSQLRGSHGIAQLSDFCFSLERNGQADTEEVRNRTTVRILKNRFSGETGPCCWLQWDKQSGRLREIPNPRSGADDDSDFKEVSDGFQV